MRRLTDNDLRAVPTFAGLLKAHREAAGWSQKVFAAIVGCDRSFITLVESGLSNPRRDSAVAMADALELSLMERVKFLAAAGYCETHVIAELVERSIGRRYTWEARL